MQFCVSVVTVRVHLLITSSRAQTMGKGFTLPAPSLSGVMSDICVGSWFYWSVLHNSGQ